MKLLKLVQAMALAMPIALMGCGSDGDDGATGPQGETGQNGDDGQAGSNSLISQTALPAGNEFCFQGGLQLDSGLDANSDGELSASEVSETTYNCKNTSLNETYNFVRIASFPVCSQIEEDCNTDEETAAEILDVSEDGLTLVYSDSPQEVIGFIDITDSFNPTAAGTLAVGGEPTSVAVAGDYVLVGVNTSEDFINTSGVLKVVRISDQTEVASLDLGGQPDSVAVSPDGQFAAIAIENERDEDLDDGQIDVAPQAPAGYLVVVNLSDAVPANWTTTQVEMTGLADVAPTDPEPEYVDINEDNIAVVTLQENNYIVLVDLATATVSGHFSAGSVDLDQIDTTEEDPSQIIQNESELAVAREPDGVSWINSKYFATADEGDMNGGSRGFTVFNTEGEVAYTSGSDLDHMTVRFGHYPDGRSGNKGNEPENAEVGIYGDSRYLFVNSERSSLVFVYDVADPTAPLFKQVLPAAAGPEGVKAIPSRNLLVAASEDDNRGDKLRSAVNIYSYVRDEAAYPTLESVDREDGTPIPFSALSGLAADSADPYIQWALEDSFYGANRIFMIDTETTPYQLIDEVRIKDTNDVLATGLAALSTGATADANGLDDLDIAAMINADKTVNIDGEGIAVASDGGFWIASEGSGTVGDESRPVTKLNMILKLDFAGVIEELITLPSEVNDIQLRFGFEGITESSDGDSELLVVAFQRAWGDNSDPLLGLYDLEGEEWSFVNYELDAVESQDGGWVGLSDIAWYGSNSPIFFVLERDNKGGPDAAIKRIYMISLAGLADGDTIAADGKFLVMDLLDGSTDVGGLAMEKIEGLSYNSAWDEFFILNDNDGVDDNSGETQMILIENVSDLLPF